MPNSFEEIDPRCFEHRVEQSREPVKNAFEKMRSTPAPTKRAPIASLLASHEQDILKLLADGWTASEIAKRLRSAGVQFEATAIRLRINKIAQSNATPPVTTSPSTHKNAASRKSAQGAVKLENRVIPLSERRWRADDNEDRAS